MGRPRLYATDAERQAEHRHRQAQRQAAREGSYQALRAQCWRLHRALTAAAAAGDPGAQALVHPTLEATLHALATHFETVAGPPEGGG